VTETLGPLLDGFPAHVVQALFDRAVPRTFQAGEAIASAGEPARAVHFVISGRVRSWAGDEDPAADGGRTLRTIGPGEHIGASAVLAAKPHPATLSALTLLETFSVGADDFIELCREHPIVSERLCQSLSRALLEAERPTEAPRGRGLHSLAIVVAAKRGAEIARALADRISRDDDRMQSVELRSPDDGDDAAGASPLPWCVSADEQGASVAVSRAASDGRPAVVVARAPRAAAAAVRECDQAALLVDAGDPPDWVADLAADLAGTRTVVVEVREGTVAESPRSVLSDLPRTALRVGSATGAGAIDRRGVERLYRRVTGRRAGLALGGGGARGIAHIGVMGVLEEAGLVFDAVAGTSAGAIVATAYAAGVSMTDLATACREEFTPPRPLCYSAAGRRLFLLRAFRGTRIETIFRRILGDVTFEQLDLPTATTSVDLISGEQVIHETGDVVSGVLASVNHPMFGRPILRDGRALVDGGLLMNVPSPVLAREQCDVIIAVDVGAQLSTAYARDIERRRRGPGYLATLGRAIDVAQHHITDLHRQRSDLLIKPKTASFRLEDFHAVDALVACGTEAAREAAGEAAALVQQRLAVG